MQSKNNQIPLVSTAFINDYLNTHGFKVLNTGRRHTFAPEFLFKLPDAFYLPTLFVPFYGFFLTQMKERPRSFWRILMRWFLVPYIKMAIMFIVAYAILIANPFLLREMIRWYTKDDVDFRWWPMIIITIVVFFIFVVRAFLITHGNNRVAGMMLSTYLIVFGMVFEKLRRVLLASLRYASIEAIISALSYDLERLVYFASSAQDLVANLIVSVVYVILILVEIHWCGLIGLGLLLFIILLQVLLNYLTAVTTERKLALADQRARTLDNALVGIKPVKYNVWEEIIQDTLTGMRRKEQKYQRLLIYFRTSVDGLMFIMPLLSAVIAIVIYKAVYGDLALDLASVFYIITLYDSFTAPFRSSFNTFIYLVDTIPSIRRINRFVNLPENTESDMLVMHDVRLAGGQVLLDGVTASLDEPTLTAAYKNDVRVNEQVIRMFSQLERQKMRAYELSRNTAERTLNMNTAIGEMLKVERQKLLRNTGQVRVRPVLSDVSLNLPPGDFVAVVGGVGAGKSSLLQTILHGTFIQAGEVSKSGRIAFLGSEPFLMHASIKDNILFGSPEDPARYQAVLAMCELAAEVAAFPFADHTIIGDRGVMLSGGQKHRIALARAVYSDSDIYLADDILGPMDAKVRHAVFRNVFEQFLSSKTRVLVVQADQYLDQFNRVVMMKKGRILCQGRNQDLCRTVDEYNFFVAEEARAAFVHSDRAPFFRTHYHAGSVLPYLTEDRFSSYQRRQAAMAGQMARVREERSYAGYVSLSEYADFFGLGGWFYFLLFLLLLSLMIAARIVADWWVGYYSSQGKTTTEIQSNLDISFGGFVGIYVGIAAAAIVFSQLKSIVYAVFYSRASFKLFDNLADKILHKMLRFFDVTPVGQLMTLTAKDTDVVDVYLPLLIYASITAILQAIGTFVLVSVSVVLMIPVFVVLLVLVAVVVLIYMKAATDLKRLEMRLFSAIISNVVEFYKGLVSFRSYNKIGLIEQKYTANVAAFVNVVLHNLAGFNFSDFMINLFFAVVVGLTFMFISFSRIWKWGFTTGQNNSLAATTLNWILIIPGTISGLLFSISWATRSMTSVQRMLRNVDDQDLERPWHDPAPPAQWPANPVISARNLTVRYRPDTPIVLNGISFDVNPREKIGIVGRTGSGKSSIVRSLARILELEDEANGAILVDGVPAHSVGLHHLRKVYRVIPQDPFCLTGTIRLNIDPKKEYSDQVVKNALIRAQLWDSDLFEKIIKAHTANQYMTAAPPVFGQKAFDAGALPQILGSVRTVENFGANGGPNAYVPIGSAPGNGMQTSLPPANGAPGNGVPYSAADGSGGAEPLSELDKEKLNFLIDDGGRNLSRGQMQMICVARAIAANPRFLLMDEATANVDPNTDKLIQDVIRSEFANTTVITIAHRLQSTIHYDRVWVMDNGSIVEAGRPLDLLNRNGPFQALALENGEKFLEEMKRVAQNTDYNVMGEFGQALRS